LLTKLYGQSKFKILTDILLTLISPRPVQIFDWTI